jgi:hypothetical protein
VCSGETSIILQLQPSNLQAIYTPSKCEARQIDEGSYSVIIVVLFVLEFPFFPSSIISIGLLLGIWKFEVVCRIDILGGFVRSLDWATHLFTCLSDLRLEDIDIEAPLFILTLEIYILPAG